MPSIDPIQAASTLIELALSEDVGDGDVTALATLSEESKATVSMIARDPMRLSGITVAAEVFRRVDESLAISVHRKDSDDLDAGDSIMTIEGSARSILTAERTALNFIQRLSGIATKATHYTEAIQGTGAKVLDTRKTTPGWRLLEKYAAACGGVTNHRIGLFDLILIKDNHLAALAKESDSPVKEAVSRSRNAYPDLRVEVEADTLDQAFEAADAGADIILLDNMPPDLLRKAVEGIAGRSKTEASGGITLSTIRAAAEAGVDYVSVGAITHSATAVDIALDFELQ